MKVFAVIVTFNGKKWLDRCFSSLRASSVPMEVIVVDNGSKDNTVNYLKENYPEVNITVSEDNLGFAKANNLGIKQAVDGGADYVFLLNQDAWIEENTVSELIRSFTETEGVGIAAPMQLNGASTGLDFIFTSYLPGDFISDLYMNQIKDYYVLPFVNAAGWMVSTECINRVGGFNTSLFYHYGEDVNYCQRVYYHGFKLVLNTRCSFCHDREYRLNSEKEYRNSILKKSPFYKENILYGNINESFDIKALRKKEYRKALMSCLLLSSTKLHRHIGLLRQYSVIEESRAIDTQGGFVWL